MVEDEARRQRQICLNITEPLEVAIVPRRSWKDHAIAYSAAAVAILSLAVSVGQGWSNRKHERLSVRPIPTFATLFGWDRKNPGLVLRNRGLGPAIIGETALYLDGEYLGKTSSESWGRLLREANLWNGFKTNWHAFDPNDAITQESETRILVLPADASTSDLLRLETVIRNRLSLEICYCSMYDECARLVYHQGQTWTDQGECGGGELSMEGASSQ